MSESSVSQIVVRIVLLSVSIALGVALSGGCARFKEQPVATENANSFSIARSSMNPGAVAVQLAVVQLDSDQSEMFERFWDHLDQLKLPLAVRKKGDQNGLRYAVMSPQIPSILPTLLKSREIDLDALDDLKKQMAQAGLLKSPPRIVLHQRIENDTGEDYAITTSDIYPQKRWSIEDGNGPPLTGFGELVKGVYRFTGFPQPDGAVRLVMLPEIHHGVPRHRYDVSQRTFLMNQSQIETKVTPLEFKVDLRPGESLIIAPNGTGQTLGDLLFGHQGLALGGPRVINQKSKLDLQIEQAVREIDATLGLEEGDLVAPSQPLENSDAARWQDLATHDVNETDSPPVTPLLRFLMIRLLHAQSETAFDGEGGERLTTVSHE